MLIRPEQITLAPFARSAEGVTGKVRVRMLGAEVLAPGDEVCLSAIGQVAVWPEGSF